MGNSAAAEADSTTTTTTSSGVLHRPEPPPSLFSTNDDAGACAGETIEEAGLKWRLIGGNRKGGGGATNTLAARSGVSRKDIFIFYVLAFLQFPFTLKEPFI